MKFLYLVFLLVSCVGNSYNSENNIKDSIHVLGANIGSFEESFESNCLDCEEGKTAFKTKTLNETIHIELIKISDKLGNARLVVITKDSFGRSIDSLILFHTPCYNGTDSAFNPKITITKEREIRTFESYSFYSHETEADTLPNGIVINLPIRYEHVVNIIYDVNSNGTINESYKNDTIFKSS